jgi:hypothetical protein
MVIKTDSLGNPQWTKYFGNPGVDDDMALVALADDGNYIVATVYGEVIYAPEARSGRLYILKIDNEGNTLYENVTGPNRLNFYIKNLRKINDGYLLSGFSKQTDTATFQYYSGWIMKMNNNYDSIWYRDYIHIDENWENYFYDASPTSDNGYIAIGKARPDVGESTSKMWVVKVDSMGCDTAGCATGTFVKELPAFIESPPDNFKLYPNPAMDYIIVELGKTNVNGVMLTLYDGKGNIIKRASIPGKTQDYVMSLKGVKPGIYILKAQMDGKDLGSKKFSIVK